MSNEKIQQALEAARKIAAERVTNKLAWLMPHRKQLEFFALGGKYRQRAMLAANRVGKTEALCSELSAHITGQYPPWWPETARRFTHATDWIAVGKTAQTLKDITQKRLLGDTTMPSGFGTGLIPKDAIIVESKTASHGVPGGIEKIAIKHASGGVSTITFRSGQQGAALFEGMTITGGIYFDEEPSENHREGQLIYDEALMRVVQTTQVATPAIIMIGFTPVLGRTPIVKRFLDEVSPDRAHVTMTLFDAPHIPEEEKQRMVRECLPHLYKARILGIPGQGENSVWAGVDLDALKWKAPPINELPQHWVYIWAIDPGLGHPFAATLCGYDRDEQIFYVIKAIRVADLVPLQHCDMIRRIAPNVRVAWPKDAGNREKGNAIPLISLYRQYGLDFMQDFVSNSDGSHHVEPGILEMREAMMSLRFRVNEELGLWFEEARDYHRDDNGNIIAKGDDLMSASRYAWMAIRKAGTQTIHGGDWREARARENTALNTREKIRERSGYDVWSL